MNALVSRTKSGNVRPHDLASQLLELIDSDAEDAGSADLADRLLAHSIEKPAHEPRPHPDDDVAVVVPASRAAGSLAAPGSDLRPRVLHLIPRRDLEPANTYR